MSIREQLDANWERIRALQERMGDQTEPTADRENTLTEVQERLGGLQERIGTLRSRLEVPEPRVDMTAAERIIDTAPADQLEAIETRRQEELDRIQTERDQAREERKTLTDRLRDTFAERQPMEEKIRQEREDIGMIEMLDAQRQQLANIQDMRQRATHLIEQRDSAIAAVGQQGIVTPFISQQQARVAENYDRRISTISSHLGTEVALYEAKQGHIQQARSMVAEIVDAYTFDTKMELEKHTMFLDINRDEIAMLDQSYQQTLQESQRYWEKQHEQERAEREAVLNLMLEYDQAGVSLDDSIEDAVKKSAEWSGIQPDADVKELMLQYNPLGADIKESDTFAQAVNKASTAKQEQPVEVDWQLRTVGRDLVRVDTQTGETELLARGAEAAADPSLFWDREDMAKTEPPVWFDSIAREMMKGETPGGTIGGIFDRLLGRDEPVQQYLTPELKNRMWDDYRRRVVDEQWTEPTPSQQRTLERMGIDWRLPDERRKALDALREREEELWTPYQ